MLKKILLPIFLIVFCSFVLGLSLKGISGNPTEKQLNSAEWTSTGPFELSPDRGRFALTYSMLENKTFFFSTEVARFATPDLGFKNGHYVSLFAPGVSFVIVPGYIVGKMLGSMQVGAYSIIAFFALINAVLIYFITKKIGANIYASGIASLTFLLATPAFSYGVNLYQHHISTFLILSSIYFLHKYRSLWILLLIWFLCALSIPIDYPNLILMLPIGLEAFRRIIYIKKTEIKSYLTIKIWGLFSLVGVVLPLLFFLWFNNASYGNPLQFSGTVASVVSIGQDGKPNVPQAVTADNAEKYLKPDTQKKSALGYFKPRNFINGLYIHLISPDRGILFFAPVLLFSLIGLILLYKVYPGSAMLLLGVFVFDLILYSMWGDPWGGWAFGSRYMIPGYAMLAIFVGVTLTWARRNTAFLLLFFLFFALSIGVNTLGAITSNQNPPKVEVLALEKLSHKQERYSFDRNYELLTANFSKSFIWQTFLKENMTAEQYYYLLMTIILIPSLGLFLLLNLSKKGGLYELK